MDRSGQLGSLLMKLPNQQEKVGRESSSEFDRMDEQEKEEKVPLISQPFLLFSNARRRKNAILKKAVYSFFAFLHFFELNDRNQGKKELRRIKLYWDEL